MTDLNLHGFNLIFLMLPWMFFFLAYKYKFTRKMFIGLGLISLVAMPIKLVNSPSVQRHNQDSITFDRHQGVDVRVIEILPDYAERMKTKDEEMQTHSERKYNSIVGDKQ